MMTQVQKLEVLGQRKEKAYRNRARPRHSLTIPKTDWTSVTGSLYSTWNWTDTQLREHNVRNTHIQRERIRAKTNGVKGKMNN